MIQEVLAQCDLEDLLDTMKSYLQSCDKEERNRYFHELSNLGLFHDAIGKVVMKDEDIIYVAVEY